MTPDTMAISSEELMGCKGFILYIKIDNEKESAMVTRVIELINNP